MNSKKKLSGYEFKKRKIAKDAAALKNTKLINTYLTKG